MDFASTVRPLLLIIVLTNLLIGSQAILTSRPHPEMGFRSCLGLIRLGDRYGRERLEAACGRALALQAPSYRSVDSILRHGLDQLPLSTSEPSSPATRHENLRGPAYFAREVP
jgi:hypothetical protein